MRKIILTLVLLLSALIGNAQAKSFVFNIDEVDSVTFNGQNSLIEDVRDGYVSIKGIIVDDESVRIDLNSNIKVQFRNGLTIKNSQATMSAAVSSGGDMGGGGK